MKFRCDCRTHIIEIIYDKPTKKDIYADITIAIFNIYSPKTGKKYKKPKLIADVVLMNNSYPKEMDKCINFFSRIPKQLLDNKNNIICSNCSRKVPNKKFLIGKKCQWCETKKPLTLKNLCDII